MASGLGAPKGTWRATGEAFPTPANEHRGYGGGLASHAAMIRLARWALKALLVVGFVGVAVFGGEIWWASRGRALVAPEPPPTDSPVGPPGGAAGAVVVWLGDSTAAGVGASGPDAILPQQVGRQLGQPARLTVLARSGARVADVLRHQLPQVAGLAPTEVFISVGANDTTHLTSRSTFRRDYERVLSGLPTTVTRIVLLGVPDMGASPRLPQPLRAVAGWRGRYLAADVRNLARRHHAVFVDIAGRTGPTVRHDTSRYFASDRYHPGDAGYQLWARAVTETVTAAGASRAPTGVGA